MTNSHPLDPLSADEIRQAAAIVRRMSKVGDTWRFASIELKEPAKAARRKAASETRAKPWSSAGTAPTARPTGPSSR